MSLSEKIDYLIDRNNRLASRIDDLFAELVEIRRTLLVVQNQTTKMDEHVDFVEGVYDSIKAPFHYVIDKFRPLTLEDD